MHHMVRHFQRFVALLLLVAGQAGAALPEVFAVFTTDRQRVHAGEHFPLTLAIFTADTHLDKQISLSGMPAADALKLQAFEELVAETTTLEGRPYEVRRFRAWASAPVAGTVTLAPTLQGTLIETQRAFFFMTENRRAIGIPVQPFALTVSPLPHPPPEGFSGLVGRFRFTASAAPLELALGDLVTVTSTVEGDALPDAVAAPPQIPDQPGLKAYPPTPAPEDSSPTRKAFRQTVVVSRELPAIPSLRLVYFDTATGQYESREAGPFPLTFHAERAPVNKVYTPAPSPSAPPPQAATPPQAPAAPGRFERWRLRLTGKEAGIIGGTEPVTIRLAPAPEARAIGVVAPGTRIVLDARSEGWVRIASEHGLGWVEAGVVVQPTEKR